MNETKEEKKLEARTIKGDKFVKKPKTGNWGYFCRQCGDLAFIFPGDNPPKLNRPIEYIDYHIRGQYVPRRKSVPICTHCSLPVRLAAKGTLMIDDVVDLNSFCRARGKSLADYGYDLNEKQKQKDFFYRDEDGKIAQYPMFYPENEEKGVKDPYKKKRTVIFLKDMPGSFTNKLVENLSNETSAAVRFSDDEED